MNPRRGLSRVTVVGGGVTALCAAIAFARALPDAAIALFATPPDPAALADRLPAVDPRAMALLARLGIGEAALVRAGAATHRVGQRFTRDGAAFAIGEGDGITMLAGAALHQLWRAHGEGPFATLVPGAALAAAERFVHPADTDPLLSRIDYALRLDAARAAVGLTAAASAAGVRIVPARTVAAVSPSLIHVDGAPIEADLFIDASGPAALLAAQDAAWIDWSATLPADRLLLGSAPAAPSPTESYDSTGDGWTARWPLAARTITGFAYAEAVTPHVRARRLFKGEAERIVVAPRRQVAPFAGKVLALGDAAAALGPFGWLGLPLALAQLEIALELMPARGDGPQLAAEYNRRAGLAADHMHAYAAAWYLAGPGRAGPFWHPLRCRAGPPELDRALEQFARRGTLPPVEEAMIPRSAWQQMLIGLGIRPERVDPIAASVPHASAVAALTHLRRAVEALPARLPPYPHYLDRMMQAAR
ncbi:tryptophan 7-halogenase [uncultured Sphingomonas sp.]|uniref:tryptophan 7-halogenase n=1 Tax=uncultured Sphingomonas sp. TaxID=158754 RepID=UPI002592A0D4|nr:tryptophan 7-halogenase [uncultured Sphingomonas sp.]